MLAISFFRFWPVTPSPERIEEVVRQSSPITIEQILPTVQQASIPAPPRPRVPVLAPEYEIVEEDVVIEDLPLPELPNFQEFSQGQGQIANAQDGAPVQNPRRAPSVVRIVEPTLAAAARDLKAEITVRFLISATGAVEEARIVEMRLYEKNGSSKVVQGIGKGVEQSVLEAAYEWKFRPAQHMGEAVKAFSTQIFSIGF